VIRLMTRVLRRCLQVVVDVTNPMKSDYKKLGQPKPMEDTDCVCDIEDLNSDEPSSRIDKSYHTAVRTGTS